MFIDFNAANAVYFRAGKQVLQWGRGYLWNPTDLINVQRKSFTDLEALRQGVFGLRVDAVFARWFHLYTFVDLNQVADLSDIAYAARAEFLLGSVAYQVLRLEPVPVLIHKFEVVREMGSVECRQVCGRLFQRVLHPTDFSETSNAAFNVAKRLKAAVALPITIRSTRSSPATRTISMAGVPSSSRVRTLKPWPLQGHTRDVELLLVAPERLAEP